MILFFFGSQKEIKISGIISKNINQTNLGKDLYLFEICYIEITNSLKLIYLPKDIDFY